MSGKLPIDRVREAQDAPRIYELEKQQYTEQQADLREVARTHESDPEQDTTEEPADGA
jgi:hypothetical protein